MINLILSQSAMRKGILNPVACLIRKFEILPPERSGLDEEIREVSSIYRNSISYNEGAGSSIEPIVYQTLSKLCHGRLSRKNNLVDSVNIVSLKYGVCAGVYDGSSVVDDIVIDISSGEDLISLIDTAGPQYVPDGSVLYKVGSETLAWIGSEGGGSEKHSVAENTNSAIVVILGNESSSEAENRQVCLDILRLVRRSCPNAYGQIIPTVRAGTKSKSFVA